jgi:CRISPR/Cas system-associated exonuclease Cas4 (RecB family)
MDSLSASAVKKFYECPKKYSLRYINPHPTPEDDDNKYILLGSDIHNAVESVLEENGDLRDQELLYELIKDEDEQRYPEDMEEKAEDCIETFSKYISKFVGDDIKAIEEKWIMDYKGMDLVGYCDLVEGDTIVDWKTGSSEDKEVQEKIQASFYIKLYENEYGEYPEKVVFVYGEEGELSVHKRISDDGSVQWNSDRNKYWEDVEKVINQMLLSYNRDEWEADPERDKCHWCDYKLYCADSKIGAEYVKRKHIDVGF